MRAFGLMLAIACCASAVAGQGFVDVTKTAGVTHAHKNRTFRNQYSEIMAGYTALGSAVAVADFDQDGDDDFYLTSSEDGSKNHLYRNDGGFRFTEVGEAAGVADANDAHNACADALWFDYNGDRYPDLLLVRFGSDALYENLGDGTFRDVTRQAGLGELSNSITAIAFDYDRDGDLDLAVGAYFQPVDLFEPDSPRFFPESFETAANGGGMTLYRNDKGKFTDVTDAAGLRYHGWTLDLGHADADQDGDDDIYAAVDFGPDHLFRNNGDGTFTDVSESAIGIDTKKGMNVDWGDYDNDGLLDIYVTNIFDDYMREGNFFWKNLGDWRFLDVAKETGTARTGWGWAAKFFDYDNDGWLDLYVLNGWVSAGNESYVPDIFQMIVQNEGDFADVRKWPPMGNKSLSGCQTKMLFHNDGDGSFLETAARYHLDSKADARGLAVVDFDQDGSVDLVATNAGSAPILYRNQIEGRGHWIQFRLVGKAGNPEAIGAQIHLRAGDVTLMRFVDGGNGFAGQSSTAVHFGLGAQTKVDAIDVRWPDGSRQSFSGLRVDKRHVLRQGERGISE
ncbi:MAG: CRTAC1 family protein [Bryobacterales bacterium]